MLVVTDRWGSCVTESEPVSPDVVISELLTHTKKNSSPDLRRFSATRNGATTRDTGLYGPRRNPPFGGVCAQMFPQTRS